MNQQLAYLNQLKMMTDLYQFMVKLCWLKAMLDAQNPTEDACPEPASPDVCSKEKSASGAKKSAAGVHRGKSPVKSLRHQEKSEVSTMVASGCIKGRMYDFNNGRFLSVDPFIQGTDSQAINPYSYIQNNPLAGVDPTGYLCEDVDDGGDCDEDKPEEEECDHWSCDLPDGENIITDENGKEIGIINIVDSYDDNSSIGGQAGLSLHQPAGKVSATASGARWENGWYATQQGLYDPNGDVKVFDSETGTFVDPNPDGVLAVLVTIPLAGGVQIGLRVAGPMASRIAVNLGLRSGLITRSGYVIHSDKFKYFFGKVTKGATHNITRSAQNLKNLNTLGIHTRKQLLKVFDEAANNGQVIGKIVSDYGTTVTRSVNVANKGKIEVKFFYETGKELPKVTTIIPKIFK